MRKLMLVALLLVLPTVGCQLSDGQRYVLASQAYQGAVHSIVSASKAGVLGRADLQAVAPFEEEAFDLLAEMRVALRDGQPIEFAWYHTRLSFVLDRLIALQAKADVVTVTKP